MDVPLPSLRTRLRFDTAPDHARVDAAFGALDLASRDDYVRFLAAHEWAMRAVEARVPDLPRVRPLLVNDLARLGAAPLEREASDALAGADALGVEYVVAGAHFGAAVLRRRVMAAPDPELRAATGYLASTAMRERWQTVRARLEGEAPDGPAARSALRGTKATFALFAEALERTCRETA